MFGLGKPRTKLGKFLDRKDISQEWLVKHSGLARDTISDLCDEKKQKQPTEKSMYKIVGALRRHGWDVSPEDLWDI